MSKVITADTTVTLLCDCGQVLEVPREGWRVAVSNAGWYFRAVPPFCVVECLACTREPSSGTRFDHA